MYCGSPDGVGVSCGQQLLDMGWTVVSEFGYLSPSRFGVEPLTTAHAMRQNGWITDLQYVDHPQFDDNDPGTVSFYYTYPSNVVGSIRRLLPRGSFDLLVAACGEYNQCRMNITDDSGSTNSLLPYCSSGMQITLTTFDTSTHDGGSLGLLEPNGGRCVVGYVLVRQRASTPLPPSPAPSTPPNPEDVYCGDDVCGAAILARGWRVVTEFGQISPPRFGPSPGQPITVERVGNYQNAGYCQYLEACWASSVSPQHVDNRIFNVLTNFSIGW